MQEILSSQRAQDSYSRSMGLPSRRLLLILIALAICLLAAVFIYTMPAGYTSAGAMTGAAAFAIAGAIITYLTIWRLNVVLSAVKRAEDQEHT